MNIVLHDHKFPWHHDDPEVEDRQFLLSLKLFQQLRSKQPQHQVQTKAQRDYNLKQLFSIVCGLGGFNRVNSERKWGIVMDYLDPNTMNLERDAKVAMEREIAEVYHQNLADFEGFYYIPKSHPLEPSNRLESKEPIDRRSLKDFFTIRPEIPRAPMWRHRLDPAADPNGIEDFTKSPLPKSSGRLMAKNMEGLLMRRLTRGLKNPTGSSFSAVLKTLAIRSWEKSFSIGYYPHTMECLLNCYSQLRNSMESSVSLSSSSFFNLPCELDNSILFNIERISLILRNFIANQSNHNIVAMHSDLLRILCEMISLGSSLETSPQDNRPSDSNYKSPKDIQDIKNLMENNLVSNLSVILKLRTSKNEFHLKQIQFNALASLSKIVHFVRLLNKPSEDAAEQQQQRATVELDSRECNKIPGYTKAAACISACIPTIMELAASAFEKKAFVFQSTELLAKIAANPNCRILFQAVSSTDLASFLVKMIKSAIIDDELSEWSITAALYISLNAMNLQLARRLSIDSTFIEDLILLASSYKIVPRAGNEDVVAAISYRRFSTASKAAAVLSRIASFVPVPALTSHQHSLASIHLYAPTEISSSLNSALLEIQTPVEGTLEVAELI